jgi:hypothetical protein
VILANGFFEVVDAIFYRPLKLAMGAEQKGVPPTAYWGQTVGTGEKGIWLGQFTLTVIFVFHKDAW